MYFCEAISTNYLNIRRIYEGTTCYAAESWGKASLAALDLVRGEDTNSSCVTKAARIIYASVQEATVKSRIYSERKGRRRKGSMCFRSARVPALLVSELRAIRELSSLCLLFTKIALRKSSVRVRKTNGFKQESIARILQVNIPLAKNDL